MISSCISVNYARAVVLPGRAIRVLIRIDLTSTSSASATDRWALPRYGLLEEPIVHGQIPTQDNSPVRVLLRPKDSTHLADDEFVLSFEMAKGGKLSAPTKRTAGNGLQGVRGLPTTFPAELQVQVKNDICGALSYYDLQPLDRLHRLALPPKSTEFAYFGQLH
ncbi:hypothetical protein NM688_g4166 [Phlebia brevispora]|uniref:Uncharacterized protein n=1 Tax=Phlebia brevispora TaxID=194682 RepID=A0ACC1T3W7_9APHY|nr:hypothetical protein NM688_g4166 [Phlebia brevispora]